MFMLRIVNILVFSLETLKSREAYTWCYVCVRTCVAVRQPSAKWVMSFVLESVGMSVV